MWRSMENTGQREEQMSCTAKERLLYSALFFQRANKEANVAAEASYVVRVMIAEIRESDLLKTSFKETTCKYCLSWKRPMQSWKRPMQHCQLCKHYLLTIAKWTLPGYIPWLTSRGPHTNQAWESSIPLLLLSKWLHLIWNQTWKGVSKLGMMSVDMCGI